VLPGNAGSARRGDKQSAASANCCSNPAVLWCSIPSKIIRCGSRSALVYRRDVWCAHAAPRARRHAGGPAIYPIPRKLFAAASRTMVRISDARRSGTAFWPIVLHITPESALRPVALVKTAT